MFYSTTIFEQAKMKNAAFGTVMIACVTFIVSGLTLFVIDRFGRKKLMFASLGGQLISSLIIGAALISLKMNVEQIVYFF